MAVPIKAKDAVPTITNFNIAVSCCPPALTNPNIYYEATSRAQTSDRTVSFLTGSCRNSTHFGGLVLVLGKACLRTGLGSNR